jgi:hypothetical protein
MILRDNDRFAEWWETRHKRATEESPVTEVISKPIDTVPAPALEIIGFDTETHLITAEHIAPKLVCLAAAKRAPEGWAGTLVSAADAEINETIDSLFSGSARDSIKVACNAKFDLTVLANYRPDLLPVIFQQLEDGKIADVIIREKLMNLTEHGDLETGHTPDGVGYKLGYSLADLVNQYLAIDIAASKKDEDSWRLHYDQLDGIPVANWPVEAQTYAADDAKYVVDIYNHQEVRRQKIVVEVDYDPFVVESFRVAVDFALGLMTCWGMAVDPEAKKKIEEMLAVELTAEKMNLLIETGILTPATPPRPAKRGVKAHAADCPDPKTCNCPPKMVAGTDEIISTTKLKAYVEQLAKQNPDIKLARTDPSERFPEGQLQVDAKFLEEYWHLDPVLEQYRHRQKLQKLVTTELPRMNNADGTTARIVHPCYDVLKETGRTSSFAAKGYPSFNCQNVDPRARGCYVARPGTLLLGADYSQMELGTSAQKCLELFGESVLANLINDGKDPHAYLGATLAYALNDDFRSVCDESGFTSPEQVFAAFLELKGAAEDEGGAIYKKYRKFAKPTGLGYPGGLGPDTFMQYAKATYGVTVDRDTAKTLREIWRNTFPEMVQYHKWVNEQTDPRHSGEYSYTSPMGMYRAGCMYCACANGAALQTPSAEGALLAVWNVVRASYDPTMGSPLYGKFRPICFIHDEIIGEIPDDTDWDEQAQELTTIMVAAMRVITPSVKAGANAVLMRRWSKDAEPTYDEAGLLTVWEPKPKEKSSV